MKMKKIGFLLLLLLCAAYAGAQNKAQEMADRMNNAIFSDCSFGVCAMSRDAGRVAAVNPARRLSPASNMKVITTASALKLLGPDYRWGTVLAHDGHVDAKGVLHGNLYVIGEGDPSLAMGAKGVSPMDAAESSFTQWLKHLRDAGIREIDGFVCCDGSWMKGEREEKTWLYEDLGTYYGTCLSGLNFFENRQTFNVYPGAAVGEPLKIEPRYPDTPWMKWTFEATTGEKSEGDHMFLFTAEGTTEGVIRGTYGLGWPAKGLKCRNNYPEYTAASEFCRYLAGKGVGVSRGPVQLALQGPFRPDANPERCTPSRPDSLNVLAVVYGQSLGQIVRKTNQDSDNFLAEMLFRTMGMEAGESNDVLTSRKVLENVVNRSFRPLRSADITIVDGSGLSRKNVLTPAFMCDFLKSAMDMDHFDCFIGSLVRYSRRVYFKTGSMGGCRCLCGYILPSTAIMRDQPEDGELAAAARDPKTIVFSIMVNYSPLSISAIDRQEKVLVQALADLN